MKHSAPKTLERVGKIVAREWRAEYVRNVPARAEQHASKDEAPGERFHWLSNGAYQVGTSITLVPAQSLKFLIDKGWR